MTEMEICEVVAKVISQKGTCAAEHKVGDEFAIGDKTPPNMCSWAFYALFPFASVLQFGGSFPWEDDLDRTTVACPDPANPVVFELKRVRK
ncbi:MAG TPA: TIGR04076 family protein [Dehalococcoidia bacterium]|nr:TIGR04076 family protein [Dehalococcoidia bacterium]